ncbi:hypothetical protein EVAR_40467_1 [Eumeta japonica]|uniref:Uncharacterized protein n=1 Tax=Eumeta variegata TaxID=151549 RepID=A0A4C1X2G9_EUMVA|nr:hypothetical protein EVAR_40467_1 [Eumeta japonica]
MVKTTVRTRIHESMKCHRKESRCPAATRATPCTSADNEVYESELYNFRFCAARDWTSVSERIFRSETVSGRGARRPLYESISVEFPGPMRQNRSGNYVVRGKNLSALCTLSERL